MKNIKNYLEFLTESYGGDYNIDNQTVKRGSLGVEFDEWITNCNKKAEEKKWNNWEFRKISKDNDPQQRKIFFMVNEKSFDSKNIVIKGEFNLDNKKGTLLESVVNELFGTRREKRTKQNLENIKKITDEQKEEYCDGCDRVKSKCICDKVEESRKKRKKKPHNTIDNIDKMIEKEKKEKEIEPAATKNTYKEMKEEIEKEEEKAERKKKKEQEKYLGENIKSFEDFLNE